MSNAPAKVFIKIESAAEQQENLKNNRKSLKVIQPCALKENLIGRKGVYEKKLFTKSKSDVEKEFPDLTKRKKIHSQGTQTEKLEQTEDKTDHEEEKLETIKEKSEHVEGKLETIEEKPEQVENSSSKASKQITAEDLTTEGNPGEHYWQLLAEKRREALYETLEENEKLYERINGLEEELDTSRNMLDEARNLVEVLTEMLNEAEEEAVNQGASTSGTSDHFESAKDDTDDD